MTRRFLIAVLMVFAAAVPTATSAAGQAACDPFTTTPTYLHQACIGDLEP